MADKKQGGGSSEKNGPNERARDAARDAGLDKDQRRELHDRISGDNLTYKQIKEVAYDIKKGQ